MAEVKAFSQIRICNYRGCRKAVDGYEDLAVYEMDSAEYMCPKHREKI